VLEVRTIGGDGGQGGLLSRQSRRL
jgi:hypothetical protein